MFDTSKLFRPGVRLEKENLNRTGSFVTSYCNTILYPTLYFSDLYTFCVMCRSSHDGPYMIGLLLFTSCDSKVVVLRPTRKVFIRSPVSDVLSARGKNKITDDLYMGHLE